MEMIKRYFPLSLNIKDVKDLVIKILIYLVLELVVGLICKVIGFVPAVGGIVAWAVGTVVGLYVLVGIVLAVLDYLKVLK